MAVARFGILNSPQRAALPSPQSSPRGRGRPPQAPRGGRVATSVMTKIDRAVLLAAGRGTRMRELTAELPKPMIKVRGKPILLHIVEGLQAAGIKNFLIIVGYQGDAVRSF